MTRKAAKEFVIKTKHTQAMRGQSNLSVSPEGQVSSQAEQASTTKAPHESL